jgi:hypothetical protein
MQGRRCIEINGEWVLAPVGQGRGDGAADPSSPLNFRAYSTPVRPLSAVPANYEHQPQSLEPPPEAGQQPAPQSAQDPSVPQAEGEHPSAEDGNVNAANAQEQVLC